MSSQQASERPTAHSTVDAPSSPYDKSLASMILGIIMQVAWIIPLFGLPIGVVGLVFGIKSLRSPRSGFALAGVVLCIIGLVLTVGNSAVGAYLGATGQHRLFKPAIAPEVPGTDPASELAD